MGKGRWSWAALFGVLLLTAAALPGESYDGWNRVTLESYISEDGLPGHKFDLYMKKGERVYVDYGVRDADGDDWEYRALENGVQVFFIDDKVWIPEAPVEKRETIEVKPKIYRVRPDGQRIRLSASSFDVEVPQADLTITQPAVLQGHEVLGGGMEIHGAAASGNDEPVEVYVYGYLLGPNNMKEDGTFFIPIQMMGEDYTIDVVAQARHCRPTTITLTGTVLPEEMMEDEPKQAAEKAMPDVDEYTGRAQPLEYLYALENYSDIAGEIYTFEGYVIDILEEGPVSILDVALEENPLFWVRVSYYGLDAPEPGRRYLFFATMRGASARGDELVMDAYFMYEFLSGMAELG